MKRAFTLIELLIIIAIIAILAAFIISNLGSSRSLAQDAVRKNDISNLYKSIVGKNALSESSYPDIVSTIEPGKTNSNLQSFIDQFLKTTPYDPNPTKAYLYKGNGKDFSIAAILDDGSCFIKSTGLNLFGSDTICSTYNEGGIGLVQNFMFLHGSTYLDLIWSIPTSLSSLPTSNVSSAIICLDSASELDPNSLPSDEYLFTHGTIITLVNNAVNEYRITLDNPDYYYYCKTYSYDNTVITNPGVPGSSPNTSTGGFSSSSSSSYSSSSPSTYTPGASSNPPSIGGSTTTGGSTSPSFNLEPIRNPDGTGSITLSWIPGYLSTHTLIRRDYNTPPETRTDGTSIYYERNDKDNQDITSIHYHTDTGLSEDYIYCYSAWAYDERTNTYSNGFVLACGGVPPSNPTNLTMTSTTNSFNLNWTKGSSTNTVIRRSINTPPQNQEQGTLVYNSTSSSFTDTDITLTKNTTYCYSIWSYNPTTASLSTEYLSSCGTLSNMASPTNLSFPTVAYNSIILNWTPGTGSTNTLIVRKQGSIPTSRTDGTTIYEDNGNAFIDTGLTDNTEYCYALYATDGTEYTEALTGCQATVQAYSSCSELKALGVNTNGVYPIKVNGNTFNAYCDMITDGGGWTLVLAQYEDDPVTNWNEGIQGDYDPSLATRKGFALNTSQIPSHNQVAFGKDLDPTFVDYADFTYSTGNIPVTTLTSPKTRKGYQVHRDMGGYYGTHNPEGSFNTSTSPGWRNTLTFDELGGSKGTWAFALNATNVDTGSCNDLKVCKGYSMKNEILQTTSESYAWTVWVRTGTIETAKSSCKAWYDSGATTDGYYKINPNGTSFITYCDMTNGGWTLVANVLGTNAISSANYTNGLGSTDYLPLSEWIHKVSDFNTYTNPAMRIDMGTVKDYFIPNGVSFSTMVTTSPTNNFKWTNDLTKPFVVPSYYSGHLGGSLLDWPVNNVLGDSRRHLSFWASNNTSIGGCCHSTYNDTSVWGKAFKMWIREGVLEPTYSSSTCKTIKTATGTTISGIYTIDPDGTGGNVPFQAYCDMVTDGGGWTHPCTTCQNGLRQYYTFDDVSGTVVPNHAPGVADASITNTTYVVKSSDSVRSYSLQFNPGTVSYYLSIPETMTNTYSMSMWVKTALTHQIDSQSNSGIAGTSGQRYVIGSMHQGTDAGSGLSLGTNGMSVYEHAGDYMPARLVYNASLGTAWNHVVLVYSNKIPYLYLNGSLVASGTVSPKATVYSSYMIGAGHYTLDNDFKIDFLRIYNRALTAAEISALYKEKNIP
ncbi:fibrinogen-like YCDxxxxGGGW domain-containing protein [Minisyncoccus archaeiphilus]|uniref:fibrinogen-like YCDxxxxGGGW domain-containing protein n=1 Tax=Minisyncoccus archaeiphilus TaxID=3238481 RepID=UPI00399D0FB6